MVQHCLILAVCETLALISVCLFVFFLKEFHLNTSIKKNNVCFGSFAHAIFTLIEDRGELGRFCRNLFCNLVEPVSRCFYTTKTLSEILLIIFFLFMILFLTAGIRIR